MEEDCVKENTQPETNIEIIEDPLVITEGSQQHTAEEIKTAQQHQYQMECYTRMTLIIFALNFLGSLGFIVKCMERISWFESEVRKVFPKFGLTWQPDLLLIPFMIPCLVYFLIAFRVLWYWEYTPRSSNLERYTKATKFSNCWTNCLLWCYLTFVSLFFLGAFFCWHKSGGAKGDVWPKVWLIGAALFVALGIIMLLLNIINVICYSVLICYHRKVRKSIEFFEENPDQLFPELDDALEGKGGDIAKGSMIQDSSLQKDDDEFAEDVEIDLVE